MSLDIFFLSDIRNALLAANEASAATAAVIADCIKDVGYQAGMVTAIMRAYRMGYKAALTTVALAFGIAPQALTFQPREETEPYKIESPPEWIRPYGAHDESD